MNANPEPWLADIYYGPTGSTHPQGAPVRGGPRPHPPEDGGGQYCLQGDHHRELRQVRGSRQP